MLFIYFWKRVLGAPLSRIVAITSESPTNVWFMKGNEYQCFVYHDGSLLYATGTFTVYTLSEDADLVMLKVEDSEYATEKVVAVDTNTDTVIVKVRNWNDFSRLEISLSLVHWSIRFKNF